MRNRYRSVLLCWTCLAAGCGAGGGPAEVQDVDLGDAQTQYLRNVRMVVDSLVTSSAEGSGGLASTIDGTVEGLEPLEANIAAAGAQQDACRKIFAGIRDLQSLINSSNGAAELKAKLDELKQLADALPGTDITATPAAGGST